MPKGDPAGYLPSVKRARKRKNAAQLEQLGASIAKMFESKARRPGRRAASPIRRNAGALHSAPLFKSRRKRGKNG